MVDIFSARIPHVYFVYGLAFFILGLTIAFELSRTVDSRFKRALLPLAIFGLVHGIHEWFEMFLLIARENYGPVHPIWLEWVRMGVLAFTFLCLGAFGVQMISPRRRLIRSDSWFWIIIPSFYALGVLLLGKWVDWAATDWIKVSETWTRYSLGIPGAFLAASGLLITRRFFMSEDLSIYGNSLIWAAIALALYGAVGQFFVFPSLLFPSTVINSKYFFKLFGFPIQIFRALMAIPIAFFTIRALRGFEINRRQKLETAQKEAQEAIAKRDTLRGELLRRAVKAQEKERTRIARELHDEIGQTLTGLATGLQGVRNSLTDDPDLAQHQLHQLVKMNMQAIEELSKLVSDLRPSLLDNMGLSAALDWYIKRINLGGLTQVSLTHKNHASRLPIEVETTLFRITQEAINNILKHAKATHAEIEMKHDKEMTWLRISDDGIGFDPAVILNLDTPLSWGLAGIRERVQLVGGECHIESSPGKGMTIEVKIPVQISKEGDNDSNKTDVD